MTGSGRGTKTCANLYFIHLLIFLYYWSGLYVILIFKQYKQDLKKVERIVAEVFSEQKALLFKYSAHITKAANL